MEWVVYAVVFIIAVVLAVALAPGPPSQKPATLDEFQIPTAEPGRPVPVVFGTYVIKSPNVVWYGDLASEPVKTSGGK